MHDSLITKNLTPVMHFFDRAWRWMCLAPPASRKLIFCIATRRSGS
jgi:hypothetical protein